MAPCCVSTHCPPTYSIVVLRCVIHSEQRVESATPSVNIGEDWTNVVLLGHGETVSGRKLKAEGLFLWGQCLARGIFKKRQLQGEDHQRIQNKCVYAECLGASSNNRARIVILIKHR